MKTTQTKIVLLALLVWGFLGTAFAVERTELDARVSLLTSKLEAMQQTPQRGIPAEVLRKAQGIILLDRTKAGFIFAYQGGGGVALVKDATTKAWSPVAFLGASETSFGLQIGGEQDFYAILLMDGDALRILTDPNFQFGGEARGTAGHNSSGATGIVARPESILVYSIRNGLYGGAVIKDGAINPDEQANHIYYGQYVTMKDILFDHKVQPTKTAITLAKRIDWYSQIHDEPKTASN